MLATGAGAGALMKRTPSYSRAAPATPRPNLPVAQTAPPASPPDSASPARTASRPGRRQRWARTLATPRALWIAWLALALALGGALAWQQQHRAPLLTQKDIDRAVLHTLNTQPLPSVARRAADKILPSVVRVVGQLEDETRRGTSLPKNGEHGKERGTGKAGNERTAPPADDNDESDDDDGDHPRRGVGSGVVIVETGLILTNLHVIQGAKRIMVTFANGFESEARVVNVQPQQDLAVIRALQLPDDLQPATLRGTGDLAGGDTVVAVGFPFGIGPSVSAGVVSGLDREFRSPEGRQTLSHLIQFDAAANPGNSGGPLVNSEGEVIGIVTAILNPTEARTFIGIGFAVPIESAAGAIGMPPF
jgi:S1-C subfamily serine protease